MYLEHFGLHRAVFDQGIAQKGDVYVGARQKLIEANLKIALSTPDSVIVFGGRSGVGKTTLAAHALRNAVPSLVLGWLGSPPASAKDLLGQLLSVFRMQADAGDDTAQLRMWRDFLSEAGKAGKRVCLLIENAQDLRLDVLHALDALTAADPTGCPGANLILTCRASLGTALSDPELESLQQRVRLSCWLDPMDEPTLREYLWHKISLASGDASQIFADGAIDAIHGYSKGVTRVVNNLCETLLTVAATRKDPQITASLVTRVAVGVLGMAPLPNVGTATTSSRNKALKDAAAQNGAGTAAAVNGQTAPRSGAQAATPAAARPKNQAPAKAAAKPAARTQPKSAAEAIAEATGENSITSIFDIILPSDLP